MTVEKVPDLAAIRAPMQAVHDSGANLDYAWRRTQLLTLRRMMNEHKEEFLQALKDDMHKHYIEAYSEIILVLDEIELCLKNLRKWMKPEKIAAPSLHIPSFNRVEKRPLLGPACLIIGPFNYPLLLSLLPAVGALAAGNPVVLKPSDQCLAVAAVLEKVVHKYFDKSVLRVVNGGTPVTTALLNLSWGKIFFTGSERVGKIVAKAAAETLTPVILELGGKCPAIVDETAPNDLQSVANRIVWAKILNAGQTCTAVDYVLVHESKRKQLVDYLLRTIEWQLGTDHEKSELGRIVSPEHARRLQELIKEVEKDPGKETRILLGSSAACKPSECYVCPTVVESPPTTARIWKEEVFGPILSIRSFQTRDEAFDVVRNMPGTPLALYVFTKQESVLQEYMKKIRAGAVLRNDCVIHATSSTMPFGGIGSSGIGSYHGKFSFDAFSQTLPVMFRPALPGTDFGMARYHPYEGVKAWMMTNVLFKLPYIPVLHSRVLISSVALGILLRIAFPSGLTLFSKVLIEAIARVSGLEVDVVDVDAKSEE